MISVLFNNDFPSSQKLSVQKVFFKTFWKVDQDPSGATKNVSTVVWCPMVFNIHIIPGKI